MKTVDHDTRVGAVVRLDDTSYTNCHFTDCTCIYGGGPRRQFSHNVVINPQYRFDGAAQETVDFLRDHYLSGHREFVEAVIDYIKGVGKEGQLVP